MKKIVNYKNLIDSEINLLIKDCKESGEDFIPTDYSINCLRETLSSIYKNLHRQIRFPDLIPDGENGIFVDWFKKNDRSKLVSVFFPAKMGQKSHIYYRNSGKSEIKYTNDYRVIMLYFAYLSFFADEAELDHSN